MSTTLNELIHIVEQHTQLEDSKIWWVELKQELLEKEKQQIMDAFVAGSERGTGEIPFNCEQYYNQLIINN